MSLDPILLKVLEAQKQGVPEETADTRHCLVFWARPPQHVRELVADIQQKLRKCLPNLYLMPLDRLHMNTFEITHSRTEEQIYDLVRTLQPDAEKIVNYTQTHRARLVKPLLGYDTSAIALTYVPANNEMQSTREGQVSNGDAYTYHHLRRDLHDLCASTGVTIDQRYTINSAHMTIARFIRPDDFTMSKGEGDTARKINKQKVEEWVDTLEKLNEWLRQEFWPTSEHDTVRPGAQWIVGKEIGLDHRKGTLWYGGGETVCRGKGF